MGDTKLITLPASDRVSWHGVKLRRIADPGDAIAVDYDRN